MLPLSLLKTAQGHPMLVELKNGETYNGHLVNCDTWMNIHLREVICTSKDGDKFWRMPECYIRGNTIKYLRVSDEIQSINHTQSVNQPSTKMSTAFNGDGTSPFFGFLGGAAALVFSCMGAAYGTARGGVGVMRVELVMKSIVSVDLGLSVLLRLSWAAGILPILIALIPSSRLSLFRQIISAFAKRGKIMQSSSTRFTVPQKFFCHFYVVGVLWTTFLLVTTWCYAYRMTPYISESMLYSSVGSSDTSTFEYHSRSTRQRNKLWQSVFLLLLMEAQVLRRLFETIYIFKYSPSARMHIFGYLTGLFFYTAAPLSLSCTYALEVFKFTTNQIEEFIVEGKNQMTITEFSEWEFVLPLIRQRWYTWIGAGLFSWGWVHQRRCHAILGMLRENKTQAEAYVVPEGDWFNQVSSPHYLAEIVIYGGLLVASGCTDLTIWLLFAFVVVNLLLAAVETHRWYLQKFENYPRHRLAIIPFVY